MESPEQVSNISFFRKNPKITLISVILTAVFLVLCILEFFFYSLLHSTMMFNSFPALQPAARDYYQLNERKILQFSTCCAQYDPSLSYRLLPGKFNFSNLEFDTFYEINSSGLRDDENSLSQPEIIFLGDSYTMGWGVEQNESFASLVELNTNLEVLNAGISSFGTAREMRLLKELDKSKLRVLVIQYSENDSEENQNFLLNDGSLSIMSKEDYLKVCKTHKQSIRYSPFLYLRFFLKHLNKSETSNTLSAGIYHSNSTLDVSTNQESSLREQAEQFLNVLSHFSLSDSLEIIVMDLSPWNFNDDNFENNLNELKQNFPSPLSEMSVIKVSKYLEDADYFLVDDHLNASGHQKISTLLIDQFRMP